MAVDRTAQLRDRLTAVQRRIEAAATSAGRDPAEVTLVVVTKFFPVEDLRRLIDLGVRHVGENKDQEAAAKIGALTEQERAWVTAHFIGQLQSNKAAHVASYADVVQSVDRVKIVNALSRGAERHGRHLDVLAQVDLDGSDAGRGGVRPDGLPELAAAVQAAPGLTLRGVMAVAPLGQEPDVAFARLARIATALRSDHPGADHISAGMSGDLEAAIRCGATHVRVGSAILGQRPRP